MRSEDKFGKYCEFGPLCEFCVVVGIILYSVHVQSIGCFMQPRRAVTASE
jgi:hypothetical protein